MLINGVKFACNTCVKGHRSSNCNHFDRPLFEIRKKGRPVTQCSFCRDLRKTKQVHIKCTCTDKSKNKSKTKKDLNIENTATQYHLPPQTCYQPNPLSNANQFITENGTYPDRMTQESIVPTPTSSSPRQCTCHETASKLLLYNNAIPNNVEAENLLNWQSTYHQQQPQQIDTPIPTRSHGIIMDEHGVGDGGFYNLKPVVSSSPSLRFLNGQTNSLRRRSSFSRRSSINSASACSNRRRRSTMSNLSRPVISVEDFDLTDQQAGEINKLPYLMTNNHFCRQQNIDLDPEQVAHQNNLTMPVYAKPSSASTISSSSSNPSTSSPNSTHTDEINLGNYTNGLGGLMATDPDELTNILNNVLMDNNENQMSTKLLEEANHYFQHQQTGTDMTRSTTISSSCSSSYAASSAHTMMLPPQQQPSWCGSLVPHFNCTPLSCSTHINNNQGESVVITITPLMANGQNSKPEVTRIVTCYCGNSCNCPGCFVHPNNNQFLAMDPPQLLQYNNTLSSSNSRSSFSSASSSYSSDDEMLHHQTTLNHSSPR